MLLKRDGANGSDGDGTSDGFGVQAIRYKRDGGMNVERIQKPGRQGQTIPSK